MKNGFFMIVISCVRNKVWLGCLKENSDDGLSTLNNSLKEWFCQVGTKLICKSLKKVFFEKCFSIQNKWISILFSSTRFFSKFSRGHVQEKFDVISVTKYDFLVQHREWKPFTSNEVYWQEQHTLTFHVWNFRRKYLR